jgi:hypothetical protein
MPVVDAIDSRRLHVIGSDPGVLHHHCRCGYIEKDFKIFCDFQFSKMSEKFKFQTQKLDRTMTKKRDSRDAMPTDNDNGTIIQIIH